MSSRVYEVKIFSGETIKITDNNSDDFFNPGDKAEVIAENGRDVYADEQHLNYTLSKLGVNSLSSPVKLSVFESFSRWLNDACSSAKRGDIYHMRREFQEAAGLGKQYGWGVSDLANRIERPALRLSYDQEVKELDKKLRTYPSTREELVERLKDFSPQQKGRSEFGSVLDYISVLRGGLIKTSDLSPKTNEISGFLGSLESLKQWAEEGGFSGERQIQSEIKGLRIRIAVAKMDLKIDRAIESAETGDMDNVTQSCSKIISIFYEIDPYTKTDGSVLKYTNESSPIMRCAYSKAVDRAIVNSWDAANKGDMKTMEKELATAEDLMEKTGRTMSDTEEKYVEDIRSEGCRVALANGIVRLETYATEGNVAKLEKEIEELQKKFPSYNADGKFEKHKEEAIAKAVDVCLKKADEALRYHNVDLARANLRLVAYIEGKYNYNLPFGQEGMRGGIETALNSPINKLYTEAMEVAKTGVPEEVQTKVDRIQKDYIEKGWSLHESWQTNLFATNYMACIERADMLIKRGGKENLDKAEELLQMLTSFDYKKYHVSIEVERLRQLVIALGDKRDGRQNVARASGIEGVRERAGETFNNLKIEK